MKRLTICVLWACVFACYSAQTNDDTRLLETVLQQASTISQLQAKVTAQENELSQQASMISGLQTSLAAQHASNMHQEASLRDLVHNITQQLLRLEQIEQSTSNLENTQATAVQQLEARTTALETQQTSVNDRLDKQEETAAFYAGFQKSRNAYHNVTLDRNHATVYDQALLNVGNHYDTHTGVFTAPYDGIYTFRASFITTSHSMSTELGIYVGDDMKAVAFAEGALRDPNDQGHCSTVVQLQAGDRVYTKLVTGDPDIWGSRLSHFSGMLVQPL